MILEAERINIHSRYKNHPDRIIIRCESRREAEFFKKQIQYALKDYEIGYKRMVQQLERHVDPETFKAILESKK